MFEKQDSRVNFPNIEHKILDFWKKEQIFKRSVDETKDKPLFTFYDGPPFATGLPHYGHILAGAIKDAIPRYKTMKGYHVPRRNGWDCHGLPVEYEIEKEKKISGKKEIEEMGVENFNNACSGIVFRYTSEWVKTINRMGRWVDFENSYSTMDKDYMESIWWVVKQIWDKGLLYEDYRSTWYCPRCGTPLSNFEVNQGYKDNVQDPSIFVKFQLKDDKNAFFLAWTTTPWTLPGNSALAIHPDFEYVKIRILHTDGETNSELGEGEHMTADQHLILAKSRLDSIRQPYEIIKTYKAKQLENLEYLPLYTVSATEKKSFYVLLSDHVTDDSGTGIVHIAPAFGEDDFNLGKKYGLPIFRTVDEDGKLARETGHFAGKFFKDADSEIQEELLKRGLLYRSETMEHTYPFCWRCDSHLMNYSTKTWFVRVSEIRDQLVKNNQQISWVPSHIKDGRFGKWLENARDWNIGRNRFWGTAMPIWKCDSCDHFHCIGGTEELKEMAIAPHKSKIDELDLHRPYIDEIKLTCPQCSSQMTRIEEVLDCWFESGSMPYAQKHYPFEDKAQFEKDFPAHFIAEGIDQTRGWFYTLHVLSAILFEKPAFSNVIVNGIGLDGKGVKLSKRLRNYEEPELLMDKVGADAMRYFLFAGTPIGEDWRFSEELVTEKMRKVLMILWNSYVFFTTYASIDGFDPKTQQYETTNVLDQWVISRMMSLTQEMTKAFDSYDLTAAARPIERFVNELSTWYIRRSRRRFWKSESDSDKISAYYTLYHVLVTVSKLIAPIMPFLSEEMYQHLVKKQYPESPDSVHLTSYPEYESALHNTELENKMNAILEIVEIVRAIRSLSGVKVRQPLSRVVIVPKENFPEFEEDLKEILLDEINVKEILVNPTFAGGEGIETREGNGFVAYLDTNLTLELKQEGIFRDVVRFIQSSRKKAGFDIEDRITIGMSGAPDTIEALKKFESEIKTEALANNVQYTVLEKADYTDTSKIHGEELTLTISK
jgi:isoleucyl-tRNA synthetase